MRRTIAAAAAVIGLGLSLVACNDDDAGAGAAGTTAPPPAKATTTTSPAATASATDPAKEEPKKPAGASKIGDTLTLHGMKNGSQIDVTMVKWVDPAKGGDEYTTPESGKRFVAVQVRIVNTGKAVYDDTPSNGMQAVDNQSQRFESDINEVSAGPSMNTLKLQSGDKALGYVVFQVPKASKITQIQFTMDSGFADETGRWDVG